MTNTGSPMEWNHEDWEQLTERDREVVGEVIGHLNFSSGQPSPALLSNLNHIWRLLPKGETPGDETRTDSLRHLLRRAIDELRGTTAAFKDCTQAEAVVRLALHDCVEAYQGHHADLLFHLSPEDFDHPYLYGAFFDAVLSQHGPWDDAETERIIDGALDHLNDFVGYRPVAVLENGRKSQVYPHERFRAVPISVQGAGPAAGKYEELITRTLEFLKEAPQDLLEAAHFYLDHLEEWAVDMRAHDHSHPVNKRTNYMFGEWDPEQINTKGYYTRFVVRAIILDALLDWINLPGDGPHEERLFDAAAALCGTMLMASSISGAGPGTFDSTVSLTSLLPIIAQRRDLFYQRLMENVTGDRKARLEFEFERTQQPFGHVRQFLNMQLAGYGARQLQHRELAYLFARMGYGDAGQRQADAIPCASMRFECEVQRRIGTAARALDQQRLDEAAQLVFETEDWLHRGIECGALVDPWNVLGFGGQFPLFFAREDAIPDNRIETLLGLIEGILDIYSRCLIEAAASGDLRLQEQLSARMAKLAQWWDAFGTDVIDDLPEISGEETWESATHVARALTEWRSAGAEAGDISFWRQHVDQFQSAQSYAQVVDALLERRDHIAAMGLLMQWLSQAGLVGIESSRHSIFSLLVRWMTLVTSPAEGESPVDDRATVLRRMFDYLEANAEDFWGVPQLGGVLDRMANEPDDLWPEQEGIAGHDPDDPDSDDEHSLFDAAYDEVTYHDSTDDGNWGDTLDEGGGYLLRNTEFDLINREMEPRLKFLNAVAQLWQMAAVCIASDTQETEQESDENIDQTNIDQTNDVETNDVETNDVETNDDETSDGGDAEDAAGPEVVKVHEHLERNLQSAIADWRAQSTTWRKELFDLLTNIGQHQIQEASGEHDSNIEYDIQSQVKFYLLHQVVTTLVSLQNAERLLRCCLPPDDAEQTALRQADKKADATDDAWLVPIFRAVVNRDVKQARKLLPKLLRKLEHLPLLYVPFDNGGTPGQILRAQSLQSIVRFLLGELPSMGLLPETWRVLRTAYKMERGSRPDGPAITEFDRLCDIALKSTLHAVVHSAERWQRGKFDDEDLTLTLGDIVEHYQVEWLRHSKTMRLSAVDGLRNDSDWETLEEFIEQYGADLFHASQLTLGHVRAILHHGVDWFLKYIEEEQDPLRPIKLVEDLEQNRVPRTEAIWCLETVFSIIVDKFDRFLEYNTTTTQSDYGNMLYNLLEFLRLESRYDRDAWNLTPVMIAHEVLVRRGRVDAAAIWENECAERTRDIALGYLEELEQLEVTYGMRMPTIGDHLRQCFVKPLAVNRMLALIDEAMRDARRTDLDGELHSAAFEKLEAEIDLYLEDSWGSGVDVPGWLRQLEEEVSDVHSRHDGGRPGAEADFHIALRTFNLREMRRMLKAWREPIGGHAPVRAPRRNKPNKGRNKPSQKNPNQKTDPGPDE